MGSPKAALEWHGSTLLRRVTGIVAREVDGPVVVVRAPEQELPDLDRAIEFVADAREGRGPLQGLAAGLAAIGNRAAVAYVSSTDVPLLHPAFVRRVIGAFTDDVDVVLPEVGGYRQPLAAAYRGDLLATVEELIAAERMRPAFLFERCRVLRLGEAEMLLRSGAGTPWTPSWPRSATSTSRLTIESARALPTAGGRGSSGSGRWRPSRVRAGRQSARSRSGGAAAWRWAGPGRARGGGAQRRSDQPRCPAAVGGRRRDRVLGRRRRADDRFA